MSTIKEWSVQEAFVGRLTKPDMGETGKRLAKRLKAAGYA